MVPIYVDSAEVALEIARESHGKGEPFSIAMMDLEMPGMDGEQLARALRNDGNLESTRRMLVTASGRRGDASRFEDAGFCAYLCKPVRPEILRQAVSAICAPDFDVRENRSIITRHSLEEDAAPLQGLAENGEFACHVLVAEDNRVNQLAAQRMLEKLGCTVELACNGRQAVQMAVATAYDIIFMDCEMPEMDGIEATRTLRERETGSRQVPIIALTAHALDKTRERCLQAGMHGFLTKPLEAPSLEKTMLEWTRRTVSEPA